ncbi:MAG: indolepyruvate ferredoxin oxidoreductase subunit alpha [Candidatus Aureabacteria bacterium]|nr:indolepyruvate ferredoxin oxidoreductase subunit alpha [Candidatus Auribacterota bacterium]
MAKQLFSGNEAIAFGAYEAGVHVATGYPGTPSSEIMPALIPYPEVNIEWSVNEKVALEVAIGSSYSGARSLVTMKHVGVNVAADPLMTLSYTGVKGGLVIISADDPNCNSSQNEQDNRHFARFAKIPILEPSNSQEAFDFTKEAFSLSEKYKTPVMLRVTTRVCHTKTPVSSEGKRQEIKIEGFTKDPSCYVMIPAHARKKHVVIEKRLLDLQKESDASSLNYVEKGERSVGIITSGLSYQYVKEAADGEWIFKLGMSYPLPINKIREFTKNLEKVYVVEELDPFLEKELIYNGIKVEKRDKKFYLGELNTERVMEILGKKDAVLEGDKPEKIKDIPLRLPVLCPGCAHRSVFQVLRDMNYIVTGDIGCYTLGTLPPLSALDTCVCMGAGIGNAQGIYKTKKDERLVAVIGDSTFVHSGITSLINAVYNKNKITVIILDNRTTAMTGGQPHPGIDQTVRGEKTKALDFEELGRALKVDYVKTVDAYQKAELQESLEIAEKTDGVSLIIAKRDCVLLKKRETSKE